MKAWHPWLMLLPTLLLLALVVGGPIIGTVFLSMTDWDGIRSFGFIGLDNYAHLFKDAIFYQALFNNLKWMLFFLTVPVLLGLSAALLVSGIGRGQMLYRSILFVPYIISTVVTAKTWSWIYNPFVGINEVLERAGAGWLALNWLGNEKLALFSVALADTWHFWGFIFVLFLMALQQKDVHQEESAKLEGANRIRIFWHVVLPQLRPTLVLIYMLIIIWSFTAFDYVYVMTQGGPGRATELLATYMYKLALYDYQPGYASAVATTMGLFSVIVIVGFGIIRRKGWDV
ncbi:carbohydrate ABC transporter permease [Cohnella hongkongensis]|uniref:Carbohydrate ABC transporter permease n=1 Tax=Cohnella hongkongensis TaxID=178337 RepID=A0ABV9F797_9BACL